MLNGVSLEEPPPSPGHCSNAQKLALLSSLHFPTMDSREEDLDPAHTGTFKWIMRKMNWKSPFYKSPSPYLQWLSTKKPLFWLSGKAGSGKSTLMNFLITHPTRDAVLQNAFPDKKVLVAWHYLFERGKDARQKSREGLLRHLLHHLILERPALAQPIFNQHKAVRNFDSQKVWSWSELKTALNGVLQEKPPDLQIVLFIDGLDEYRPMEKLSSYEANAENEDEDEDEARIIDDGHQDVADLVRKISGFENVKLCVSSRPLLVFRDAFRPFSSIALHELTVHDISAYVAARLTGNESLALLTVLRPSFEEDVKNEILAKADGVFLWVRLVLDLLTRGLRDGDTVDELLGKLSDMPKELGGKKGLYAAMLLNLPADYHKDCYEYFQILQRSDEDLDPLVLSFAAEDPQTVFTTPVGEITRGEIASHRKRASDRILSRCGGLLETRGTGSQQHINFIHQTAKDFVTKRSNWEKLIHLGELRNFDGALSLLRAYVILLKRSRPLAGPFCSSWFMSPQYRFFLACLRYARDAESLSPALTAELLLLLDRVMFYVTGHNTNPTVLQRRPSGKPNFDELLSNCPTMTHEVVKRHGSTPYLREHWSVNFSGAPRGNPEKNFIAVAVQSNLQAFLKMSSKNRRVFDTLFRTDYPLLAYALVRRPAQRGEATSALGGAQSLPEITSLLLELGLDPNQYYEGPDYPQACTVWEEFLALQNYLVQIGAFDAANHSSHMAWADKEYWNWLANSRLLVQYGANPNASCMIESYKKMGVHPNVNTERRSRSALYCVVIILWGGAKIHDWDGGLLEMMIQKGARLQHGEWSNLVDQAGVMEVPEYFIQSVSDTLPAKGEVDPEAAVPVLEPQGTARP